MLTTTTTMKTINHWNLQMIKMMTLMTMFLMSLRVNSPCLNGLSWVRKLTIEMISEKRLISRQQLFKKNLSIGDLFCEPYPLCDWFQLLDCFSRLSWLRRQARWAYRLKCISSSSSSEYWSSSSLFMSSSSWSPALFWFRFCRLSDWILWLLLGPACCSSS